MLRAMRVGLIFIALFSGSSCRSQQMARDGSGFRQALLDMYTDQAMDNLIRARLNQPFVQLVYRDLLVQETDTIGTTASFGHTAGRTNTLAVAALTLGRSFSNVFNVAGNASRVGQMSFKADPVTDKNDIYELYLTLAQDPCFLCVSDKKPKENVHICREACGQYFWVPCEQGPLFLELVLRTSMMRGPETIPSPAYQRTVTRIARQEEGDDEAVIVWFELSEAVPNGSATMIFNAGFGKMRLKLAAYGEAKFGEKENIDPGMPTKYLIGTWVPSRRGFTPDDIVGRQVQILSDDYPPSFGSPLPRTQQIVDELDRIRANQAIPNSQGF